MQTRRIELNNRAVSERDECLIRIIRHFQRRNNLFASHVGFAPDAIKFIRLADLTIFKQALTMNQSDEIRKLERELIEAILRGDSDFLDDILAEDLSVITPFGDLASKAMMVKFDENLVNESIVTDEIKIRVYGETAIVTGRATIKSRYANQDLSGQYRFTRVYFKRDRWRIIAYQATRIAAAADS